MMPRTCGQHDRDEVPQRGCRPASSSSDRARARRGSRASASSTSVIERDDAATSPQRRREVASTRPSAVGGEAERLDRGADDGRSRAGAAGCRGAVGGSARPSSTRRRRPAVRPRTELGEVAEQPERAPHDVGAGERAPRRVVVAGHAGRWRAKSPSQWCHRSPSPSPRARRGSAGAKRLVDGGDRAVGVGAGRSSSS